MIKIFTGACSLIWKGETSEINYIGILLKLATTLQTFTLRNRLLRLYKRNKLHITLSIFKDINGHLTYHYAGIEIV